MIKIDIPENLLDQVWHILKYHPTFQNSKWPKKELCIISIAYILRKPNGCKRYLSQILLTSSTAPHVNIVREQKYLLQAALIGPLHKQI